MPYIGNQNALAYTSFAKQDFTTSATTSYTLDNPVTNANEIALFINFVRQEPTTAYTASGTSLTLTSATSASDDMYCVFLGKALQTVNPPAGSVGLSQLSATGTKDSTTFLRGDNTFASAGGTNTPAFWSYQITSGTTVTNATATKVLNLSDYIDTNSAFSSSRFTVPSGEAGKYYFYGTVAFGSADTILCGFGLNGTANPAFLGGYDTYNEVGSEKSVSNSIIFDLSVGDYVELFAYQVSGGTKTTNLGRTRFLGYKLVE